MGETIISNVSFGSFSPGINLRPGRATVEMRGTGGTLRNYLSIGPFNLGDVIL